LRLDLHNHTSYSSDGVLAPCDLLRAARARGLDCIAITDHNTVQGALVALELSEADPSLPRVIPGIELGTEAGEVIGLYVTEQIPKGLPLREAVQRIRDLGGLVYLPHPFDVFRRGAVSRRERGLAAVLSDLVEAVNGRALGPWAGAKSARLADEHGKARAGGSDAHREAEVGRAWVTVDELPTRDTLVRLVATGEAQHCLRAAEYAVNWARQASAPWTRVWRRMTRQAA
jgi:predicted metal-dependent phosphoesterase TrpH